MPAAVPSPDFERLLAVAPHPYVLLARDFTIVWVNKAYARATQRNPADLVGRNMFDAFPSGPHDPGGVGEKRLRASLDKAIQTREPDVIALIRYAIPRETPEGTVFADHYWSASHTPILDQDGHVAFILQQTDDVTELRAQQLGRHGEARVQGSIFRRASELQEEKEALRAERAHLRRLLEQAGVFATFLRGRDHVFEIANESYMRLIGQRDIMGKAVRDALPELDGQGIYELLDEVYTSGKPFRATQMPVTLLTGDGVTMTRMFLDFVYQPILEPDGTVSGIFVIGSDVTEGKRAVDELERYKNHLEDMVRERTRALEDSEAQRRRAEKALQQSQKMEAIGQLTGGVAHDFNNLLQILSGNLQLLQRRLHQAEDLGRIAVSLDAVDRGAKLAAQLLAFARRQPLEPRAIHPGRIIREMDELLRRALGEAIEVRTVIANGLWNTLTDPDQVQNAILNLAVNARDAMDGQGQITIEAANAILDERYAAQHEDVTPGQYVMLSVSDTGSGMSPEVLEKAFEPFFTTKKDGRGSGLGLSMIYGFVRQSHGHIRIDSEPGQGTTVRLYLPSTQEAEDVTADFTTTAVEGGAETILVVEDDPVVQATTVDLLKDLGYTVLRASDGQSALTLARAGIAIDLLFTDVVMPGPVRAPELAREVQALIPGIGVLFASGYTENAIMHGGRLDPGVNLLSKPYRREDLARKVRHMLNSRRAAPASPHTPVVEEPMPEPTPALRVLMVEDDPLILMDSEDMVSGMGCHVTTARDGRSALRALEHGAFDVLFTDIGLPGMSGVELAREARRAYPGLSVIFASGFSERQDAMEAAPGALFITKPYGLSDLEKAFRQVAETRG